MSDLRQRLGELVRTRRGGAPAADRTTGAAPAPRARTTRRETGGDSPGVEAFLPGGEWSSPAHGSVYVHERLRSEVEKPRATWGRLGSPPEGEAGLTALSALGLEQALFLDLETCGLGASMVFLAGTMHWNGEDFVIRQYFARDYSEEAGLTAAVAEQLSRFAMVVTFNGRSFDVPQLVARATVHRVPIVLPPHHLDLLHVSRRRWRDELPDCRLQTLEREICRRRRSGDVPSDEVPQLYHDFVRRGDAWRLVPVFHHNLLDVLTMADLVHALLAGRAPRRRFPA